MSVNTQEAPCTTSSLKPWLGLLSGLLSFISIPLAFATLNHVYLVSGVVLAILTFILAVPAVPAARTGARVAKIVGGNLAVLALLGGASLPFMCTHRDAANRMLIMNKLRQIVIAIHDYEQAHDYLPPHAICDQAGRPLLSWRVLILPYLGEGALFGEFRLDEPWDSPHNFKLLDRMPKVYAPVGLGDFPRHCTFYQGFVGPGTAFEPRFAKRLKFMHFGVGDGQDNTILLAEAGEAVPWTKPADLTCEPGRPLPALGGMFKERTGIFATSTNEPGFYVASARGQVYFIPLESFDAEVLRGLITWNGGEDVRFDQLID